MPERGIIHHLPLLLVALLIVAAAVYFFVNKGTLNIPLFNKSPKVDLQESYANPFKKETQFVNPFESYKNPFTTNR
jgi:hypothetical protein